jgi:two-component system sensor histidine kinase/response regulator
MDHPPLTRGIRWKLLTTMVGLIVVLVVFLSARHILSETDILERALERRVALQKEVLVARGRALAETITRQAENDIAAFNFSNLAEMLNQRVREGGGSDGSLKYAILMDTGRTAFVHTLKPSLQQERLDGEADLRAAAQTNVVMTGVGAGPDETLEFTLPLRSGVQPWGTLRLGFSLAVLNREILLTRAEMESHRRSAVLQSVLNGSGGILLGWLVVLWLSNRLTKPIMQLTAVARDLATGNFSAAPAMRPHVSDEVDVLANTIVSMAGDLRKTYEYLGEYNRDLAKKVDERTQQLARMTLAAEDARLLAESASSAKSSFLARMSHELRTPLTSIIGFSELLLADAEAEGRPEAVEDLTRIMASARHLLNLINEVLDLSKIEARKMDLHLERFQVVDLVEEVASALKPLAAKMGNQLVVEADDGLGEAFADQVKVRQSLINLLSNANKFTSAGRVTLRVHRERTGGGDRLVFAIMDTGIGMSPEQIGRLFQAFEQADRSTSQKFGGTGLGLVISRRFCELMGGSVHVTSRLGKGSTFTMVIPAEVTAEDRVDGDGDPSDGYPGTEGAPAGGSQRAPLVLVVDDDDSSREILRRQLENQAIKVLEAPDGSAALSLIEHRMPDMIVCDLMMPEVDGFRFLTDLRNRAEWKDIPVVVLTARPVGESEHGFLTSHAQLLIQKSETPPTGVVRVIRQMLRKQP